MRKLLLPFSLLFWLGVTIRNWFFDIGILKTTKISVPVISVGNISTGGTGKTPIVAMLIEKLAISCQLSVVSRGYGRKSFGTIVVSDGTGNFASAEDAGDEPIQLARKFPNLIVVVDEKRVRGGQKAVELGANLILLDDGFQHRYLQRDLNFVVVTGEEILSGDWLLPAGNRREPVSSLKRSDLIIISRCESANDFALAARELKSFGKLILGVKTKLKSFKRLSTKETVKSDDLANKRVIAVSGIGNPKSFESLLAHLEVKIAEHLVFPDHNWYAESDIKKIIEKKKLLNADAIVTTEKDAVRLGSFFDEYLASENVIVAEIQQEIIAGEDKIWTLVNQLLTHVD